MAIQKFEDIIAWQKAQDLAVSIYSLFNKCKDFEYKKQIERASVSISNNIAEGFDSSSNPNFIRFLYYSLASNSEVKSMLYLALRLNHINQEERDKNIALSVEISKMVKGLINSLEKRK